MSFPIPTTVSYRSTVTSSSQVFSVAMATGEWYVFTSTVACYIKQGAPTPTASAADGSTIISAGESVIIKGDLGSKLAVIRIGTTDGEATLTKALFQSAA